MNLLTKRSDDQIQNSGTGGACGTHGAEEKCMQHFGG